VGLGDSRRRGEGTGMTRRARALHESADGQIAELAERLSAAGAAALARPCLGRERLGDGTMGAVVEHTTENYHRIARFVAAIREGGEQHQPSQHGEGCRASEVELDVLLARLVAAREAIAAIGQLTDEDLDSVPSRGEMRFVDGERTLEEIVASMLKHQRHQIDALAAGLW
jgi:hypothetical protein